MDAARACLVPPSDISAGEERCKKTDGSFATRPFHGQLTWRRHHRTNPPPLVCCTVPTALFPTCVRVADQGKNYCQF
jgi:hypothetical protein